MIEQLKANTVTGYGARWVPMPRSYPLVEKFPPAEWHKINGECSTDAEFRKYLERYDSIGACFLLCRTDKDEAPVGFAWVISDNYIRRSVMIHGGTWLAGKIATPLLCRGLLALSEHLLARGFRVHSQCHLENRRSLRFLRGCGYRPYRYEGKFVQLHITPLRIGQSSICQRIKRQYAGSCTPISSAPQSDRLTLFNT